MTTEEQLAGVRWRIVLGPPGAPRVWPLAEDTDAYQVARLLTEARRTWPDAYAQSCPVGRWRDASPWRRGPAPGDGTGDVDEDVRRVLEHVSAGRKFVDVQPYPDAAARRALGRLLDDEVARELRQLRALAVNTNDASPNGPVTRGVIKSPRLSHLRWPAALDWSDLQALVRYLLAKLGGETVLTAEELAAGPPGTDFAWSEALSAAGERRVKLLGTPAAAGSERFECHLAVHVPGHVPCPHCRPAAPPAQPDTPREHQVHVYEDTDSVRSPGWYAAECEEPECGWTTSGTEPVVEVTVAEHREASLGPYTCARCGHRTGGCARCGQDDLLLGGRIGDQRFCHTYGSLTSCYAVHTGLHPTEGNADGHLD